MYCINGAMMLLRIRNLLGFKHRLDRHLAKKHIQEYPKSVQFFHAKKSAEPKGRQKPNESGFKLIDRLCSLVSPCSHKPWSFPYSADRLLFVSQGRLEKRKVEVLPKHH